jgi:hypothetical protein
MSQADGVRHHAVNADRGERQREVREDRSNVELKRACASDLATHWSIDRTSATG